MSRKWIDKKNADTFQLVHRSQRDPLFYDEDAPERVLKPVEQQSKAKSIGQLEQELGSINRRENEGQAANYGVYYDDTDYDYMQHLRIIGDEPEAVWIEGSAKRREMKPDGVELRVDLPNDAIASSQELKRTYQDQQEVPDAIAGFKPDMDPSVREVLEALEDEAFVDEGEDTFAELAQGGATGEHTDGDIDEEEWDSDDTTTAGMGGVYDHEVSIFKKPNTPGSQKRSKAARTQSTGYSMSSSSMYRNQGLTLLDDRYDQIEEEYANDNDDDDSISIEPKPERQDFMSIMDDFLENHEVKGKKLRARQTGLEQLDEIRQQLRTARIK